MSYRIYVNNYQCLGNNECPEVLINELKRQGCEIDEDGCFHNFEIKELEPIIEALEQYIKNTNEWMLRRKYKPGSVADFSYLLEKEDEYKNGLTWSLQELLENGYLFVTINFLNAIKDDYEEDFDFEAKKHRAKYKIKKGHHIHMSGY